MRVLAHIESKFPVPPEQVPMMLDGFKAWREKYRGQMESFFFFAGRQGGGGILNVPDEAALNKMMLEWPLSQYSDTHIEKLVDGDVALKQWEVALQTVQQPVHA